MVCAKEIQKKYDSEGPVGYLLGATEFAISNLKTISALDIVRKNNAGDLVTAMDRSVHGSVIQYFREIGLSVAILGEEGQHQTANPQWAILIDEIEGTQNAVNQLPYGINMAIAPWRERIQVGDLESSVVTNLYDERIFVGEKAKGAYKIVCGERRELDRTQTDVYECPSPNAYTTSDEQAWRQGRLAEIFKKVIGNQPRSIDATGTRLVELADSNICAYGDWRNATKCWDVLPSALIIQEAGYVLTDSLGFDLSNAVFYDKNNLFEYLRFFVGLNNH